MESDAPQYIARVDRQELADILASRPGAELGRHLDVLLRGKGIDPGRFFRVEYHPYHFCWLVYQQAAPAPPASRSAASAEASILAEFRLSARSACARAAAHSQHFARFGCKYELPPEPQEITPADLAIQLGGMAAAGSTVRFDREGGWQ
jgi:hypothetical protein